MIAVTGASGQLGKMVVGQLIRHVAPGEIVALVRNPARAQDLADQGVQVRQADYDDPDSLQSALKGVSSVLLISSSEVGKRTAQHANVINAARWNAVELIAYTSLLHAEHSPLALATEHRETEALLKSSGLNWVLLRNGWYTENFVGRMASALQHGVLIGNAGEGRISAATRADYAAAAAAVMTTKQNSGAIYELAGDQAFTLSEMAATLAKESHRPVVYKDLSLEDHAGALEAMGLPAHIAGILADSDAGAAKGALFAEEHHLSSLIGRATTPYQEVLKSILE